jgi:hypothetical protein
MRKILYSPGYGAGWTTWGGDTREEKLFMLEYAPFVEALEAWDRKSLKGSGMDAVPATLDVERFERDWRERFPTSEVPYLGGLRNLAVMSVPDGARVRVNEYDGFESVEIEGDYEGWL